MLTTKRKMKRDLQIQCLAPTQTRGLNDSRHLLVNNIRIIDFIGPHSVGPCPVLFFRRHYIRETNGTIFDQDQRNFQNRQKGRIECPTQIKLFLEILDSFR